MLGDSTVKSKWAQGATLIEGDDLLYGGRSDDLVYGDGQAGQGTDYQSLRLYSGNDRIAGGEGDDIL